MADLLRAYRGLLHNGPLTRLLGGEFVSSIGDWLYLVAILVLVYQVTADPIVLGIVGAARVLPYVVLSIPAGILVDRSDRRRILLVTDVARGLIMLALALLVAVQAPIAIVIGLAIVATCFSTFFGPAIGAYLPTLVADEAQLGPANSAWSMLDNLAFVIGPALGGLLIAAGGLVAAFVLNAASFAVIAVVLAGLPSPRRAGPAGGDGGPATGPAADVPREPVPGGRPARRTRLGAALAPIAGLGLMELVGAFAGGGLGVLTVLLATDVLHAGDQGTGYLNAGIGVGGLLGALGAGALVLRPSLVPILVGGSAVLAIGLAALGVASSLPLAMGAIIVTAVGALLVEVTSATVLQRAVPDELRGRTLGVMATASTLSYAAGSFLVPVLAGTFGVAVVLGITGGSVFVAGVVGALLAAPAAQRRSEAPATLLVARLAALPIFTGVPVAALEVVAARLEPIAVAPGEVVVRQGDPADRFYVIETGSFEVTRLEPGSPAGTAPALLRTMGPGEVFGEIGLLHGSVRTATVTATADGCLLALDGTSFLELVSSGAGAGLGPRLLDLRRGAPGSPG